MEENFIIDSSSVLGLYGLRPVGDIDYITRANPEQEKILKNSLGDSHSNYLPFHEKSADDLIFNPQNYLWFEGMKFISLEQVSHMKKLRRVGDIGKDAMDILLSEKIFDRRLATLNDAVMNFLSQSHAKKFFNFAELVQNLEPIFFQEGWRTENSNSAEKNILVICNHFEENILLTNNFLKEVRRQNPFAKITFVADGKSQNLISNVKYAEKILPLDSTYSQDILWQICKFVELCKNYLWRERFSNCFVPFLDRENILSGIFAFLSGSAKRTGFISNPEKIPEDIKKVPQLFTEFFKLNY